MNINLILGRERIVRAFTLHLLEDYRNIKRGKERGSALSPIFII